MMNIYEKTAQLRKGISQKLAPLVNGNYHLLEIPDYRNPGDALILKGELNFLKSLGRKVHCAECSTMMSFLNRHPSIPESDLLIFRGGGYFGDLWPMGPEFQREVLKRYPKNPIVIFPQSACYVDQRNLADAVRWYGEHKNLVICLRDSQSYEFVKKHFPNECHLVPDMAFYSGVKPVTTSVAGALCISRQDKETRANPKLDSLKNSVRSDWPVMIGRPKIEDYMSELRRHNVRGARLYDWFATHIYCPWQVRKAIEFLRPFKSVYSTRLHGGVLAAMMGKNVFLVDNSYGKIRSLYETWIADLDCVEML